MSAEYFQNSFGLGLAIRSMLDWDFRIHLKRHRSSDDDSLHETCAGVSRAGYL